MNVASDTEGARLAYGLKEFAKSVGVSAGFLRLEIGRGRLRPLRRGGRLLITREEARRYLAAEQE